MLEPETKPKCQKCGKDSMMWVLGCGWDFNYWACGEIGCNGEIEVYETPFIIGNSIAIGDGAVVTKDYEFVLRLKKQTGTTVLSEEELAVFRKVLNRMTFTVND